MLETLTEVTILEKDIEVAYVRPVPRWVISQEGTQLEIFEYQMLKLVNSFLSQHFLGEIKEDWTTSGRVYRYDSNTLWERGFGGTP